MLKIDDIKALREIATPFYYCDMGLLEQTLSTLSSCALRHRINVHYAVKANADERLMKLMSEKGFGADCVSGNEVVYASECGFPASKIMFAGVGKNDKEIFQSLSIGIEAFNCESLQELSVINEMAGSMGLCANVALRINPNIDAHTHRYVTTGLYENKFGISDHDFDSAIKLLAESKHLNFIGLQFHIGSQITLVKDVFSLECKRVNDIVRYFEGKGLKVNNIDLGGGLGVDYEEPDENPIADFETWMQTIDETLIRREDQQVHLEPGRSVVAQSGTLISRVLFVKNGETKNFAILDAGMNDLIRPALYGAYHKIENLTAYYERKDNTDDFVYDVVGPVCESSDVWGAGRLLRKTVRGDMIAIRSAGAYGQVMASKYNRRDLAPLVYSDRLEDAPKYVDYFKSNK
jgi:diaminopimelate decarboxylase